MALQAGIVGLPNVGKSTLFNAVSNSAKAQASNYRFCTIDPNVGLVDVPDPRLKKLAEEGRIDVQGELRNMKDFEVKAKLVPQGMDIATGTPEELASIIRADDARWGKLIRDAGIKPE